MGNRAGTQNCSPRNSIHSPHKHYWQIRNHGKILNIDRCQNDPNEIIIQDNIAIMKLYDIYGSEIAQTIFDVEYIDIISKYKWRLLGDINNYVCAKWFDENNIRHDMYLHQVIVYLSGEFVNNNQEIDHKDLNKLNNLRNNLRICVHGQNEHNKNKRSNTSSKFKGVSFSNNKWLAEIRVNGKRINLGRYDEEIKAAEMYNDAAKNYYGEFARINNIPINENKMEA